jgi:hypothetical protein
MISPVCLTIGGTSSRSARPSNTLIHIVCKGGLLLLLPAICGCGNGLSSVSGLVTLDGNPLKGGGEVRATVYLFPEGGTGAPAVGLVDESGEYTVSTGTKNGVLPGAYLVSISASELYGENIPGVPRSGRRVTPARYADPRRSDFRIEVGSGSNTFDFALESDTRAPRSRRR